MSKETDEKAADNIYHESAVRKRNALGKTLDESAEQIAGYRTDKPTGTYN